MRGKSFNKFVFFDLFWKDKFFTQLVIKYFLKFAENFADIKFADSKK